MNRLFSVVFYVMQWTWGLPQNLAGLAVLLAEKVLNPEGRHYRFRIALVTEWKRSAGMSLGMFVFVHEQADVHNRPILVHEYGHTLQSLLLGPLYLPVIGLPSLIWANVPALKRFRQRKNYSYYRFFPEAWANAWGSGTVHEEAPLA